ncbi:tetrahydroxynaphthalene reductase protein [Rutstroemia sp. NJR-2017a BVV2]|nr:tetrahydroxynaphthalene reductase protein [Rutstroemia sp. NJR-2017a BVV2]
MSCHSSHLASHCISNILAAQTGRILNTRSHGHGAIKLAVASPFIGLAVERASGAISYRALSRTPSIKMGSNATNEYTQVNGPLGIESASLKGKVALVTGSGRGIGREMAMELGRRGAKVIVNYANSDAAAQEVVDGIKKAGSDAIALKGNVSVVADIINLFDQAVKQWGKLDIVCSNSGVVTFGHIKDVTEEEYDRVMNINTRGQFFVAREAYKHLEVGGRLIMMGSITGQAKGVPMHTVYSGSKGAIETFVRCMAIDFGDKKITVNCIAPGGIKTDMYHKVCREYIPNGANLTDDQVDEYAATWSPLHRVGLPIDIARVVCFLASQDGEWVNGKVIGIDGAAMM